MNPLKLFKKSKYPVLKVTPETTAQQVFDAVVKHLQDQGSPCLKLKGGTPRCTNRNAEGKACAAAALMTAWEARGVSFSMLSVGGKAPKRLRPFADMISALQRAHDSASKGRNARINFELEYVAREHGVKFKTPITSWK